MLEMVSWFFFCEAGKEKRAAMLQAWMGSVVQTLVAIWKESTTETEISLVAPQWPPQRPGSCLFSVSLWISCSPLSLTLLWDPGWWRNRGDRDETQMTIVISAHVWLAGASSMIKPNRCVQSCSVCGVGRGGWPDNHNDYYVMCSEDDTQW